MGHPVFISYARQASREHAEALHRALGPDLAYLDSEELRIGRQFSAALVDALFAARVVVVLADPAYFTRWYCLLEFRVARMPFLRIVERPESTQAEKDDALRGIVIALPPGSPDAVLERLPPLFRTSNWPTLDDPDAIARLVSERLAANLPTLGERYEALGEADAMRQMLLEAMRLPSPQRIGAIPSVPRIGLPASLQERFVGRADDLWRIHDVMTTSSGEPAAASLTGSIEAGGGFGKTRLALEYLYRFGTRHFLGGLFWIDAEQDVESQHYDVVKALDPAMPGMDVLRTSQGGVAGALARVVRSRADGEPLLFVIDNVPEPEAGQPPLPLSHWCPLLGEVAVLATSRTRVALGAAGSIVAVQIDTLEPDAAVRLLTMGIRRAPLSEAEWLQIAKWVGHLPLALELLNGLLTSGAMAAGELLEMSRERRTTPALDSAMDVLRGTVPAGALRGITEAFAASYERLTEAERYAARLIAWMSPAAVPDFVLEAVEGDPFTPSTRATLRGRHFVTPSTASASPGSPTLFGSMHRVLADFLRSRSPHPYLDMSVVLRAYQRLPDPPLGDERLRSIDLIAPAVAAITAYTSNAYGSPGASLESAVLLDLLLSQVGVLSVRFFTSGAYAWARACMEASIRARSRVRGEDDPSALTAMSNLGVTLYAWGDFADAEHIHERVLATRRRTLGEEHPDTLTSMNNLAICLQARGETAGAKEMLTHVLEARLRTLGEDHQDTLNAMNNLAQTLSEQGDFPGSQDMQERALARQQRVLGEDHRETLISMYNLANIFQEGDEPARAKEMHERVLATRRRVLGREHPDTSISAWTVVTILLKSDDVSEARRVVTDDLLWMLERDPATLSGPQRDIRDRL